MYALIDTGFTLSYATPYVSMEFEIEHEQLRHLYVSSVVDEFIMATQVYRDCIVTIHGRDTTADLI